MGYPGDDRGGGGDRWQGREQYRERGREQGRAGYGGQSGGYRGDDDDDRGFFDRAGDEVRSWFGDDDAQRRREMDQRRWEQEQRMTGRRDNEYGRGGAGPGSFGGGWGNQRGESWNRERPGERGWYADRDGSRGGGERDYGPGEREGWFSDSRGGERGERYGGSGGGGDYGSGYGRESSGSGYSRAGPSRSAEAMRERGGQGSPGRDHGGLHDPHYSEWRQRQIEDLDRDYEDYRREHQSKFESEFGSWRSKRQGQRQALNKVNEHMEVVGSDGSHVGTVDKVRGDRIILTRADPSAGGVHHSVPCSWVDSVEDKVTLNRSADDARSAWRTEERSQALFSEDDGRGGGVGGEGPRNLNRSFSGTYEEGGRADGSDSGKR
jgi:hypothetical protein